MKKEAVVAQLLYDKDTLVGRVVEVEDLTPEQIREALAHGAASGWKGDDDCWLVIDQRGDVHCRSFCVDKIGRRFETKK